jgi:hypothetical protein
MWRAIESLNKLSLNIELIISQSILGNPQIYSAIPQKGQQSIKKPGAELGCISKMILS